MTTKVFHNIFLVLLLVFLGVLSVSGTIALRNLLHLALLVMIVSYVWIRWKHVALLDLASKVPLALWAWLAYLLVFPLIAPDGLGALSNLIGNDMWGLSILTCVLAFGAFLIAGFHGISLWTLALVSAVPVFIHLTLTILAWAGILQPDFYQDPTLFQVIASLKSVILDPALVKDSFVSFPLGFKGIEPMHGNFGYPSSQAICFGIPLLIGAWREGKSVVALKASALVMSCFVSVVIAQSRAAAYFGIFLGILSTIVYFYYLRFGEGSVQVSHTFVKASRRSLIIAALLLCGALGFFLKIASGNSAWYSMWDKVSLGFTIEKPSDVLCDGFAEGTYRFVKDSFPDKSDAYLDTLVEGLKGDGARVMLARVGLELSATHPWGLNGGRNAYEQRMEELCGHPPRLKYAHAHNAWVNLVLALGWLGATLYACLLIYFAGSAWAVLLRGQEWQAAFSLFLLSTFWLLRGFTDAVFQEHYLQMQAFFLLFLWLRINSAKPGLE